MAVDIDQLSEPELVDLYNRIAARLKMLRDLRAHSAMLEFRIGERVSFRPDGHPVLFGVVTKYNRKSVTLITDAGQQWNVSPSFLRKVQVIDAS
jgi:hypothetical protein